MKIRSHFVSNSSTANFICTGCGEEYDLEFRGGLDEEDGWNPPDEGLCDGCSDNTHFICGGCGETYTIDEGIKTIDSHEIETGVLYARTFWACGACLARCSKYEDDLKKWSKKVSPPDYILTKADKEVIRASQT